MGGDSCFVVLETEDIQVVSVRAFRTRAAAEAHYEDCARRNQPFLDIVELDQEAPGTLAMAGDDAYAVQLVGCTLTDA